MSKCHNKIFLSLFTLLAFMNSLSQVAIYEAINHLFHHDHVDEAHSGMQQKHGKSRDPIEASPCESQIFSCHDQENEAGHHNHDALIFSLLSSLFFTSPQSHQWQHNSYPKEIAFPRSSFQLLDGKVKHLFRPPISIAIS